MAQITTTNRQAILELISQADETTEVAGLSASVTQLQVDVAGLSASIGNEINLGDFIVVDVPSGVATFSASQSITLTSTDGTQSVSQTQTYNDYSVAITGLSTTTNQTMEYDAFEIVSGDGLNYASLGGSLATMTMNMELYDDNAGTTANLGLLTGQVAMNTTDGTNTEQIVLQPGSGIVSTSTDGTIITTQTINSTSSVISVNNDNTLYAGTSQAFEGTLEEVKGVLYFIIPNNTLSAYFNTANNVVAYFDTPSVAYYLSVDIDNISTTSPSIPEPSGTTRLRIVGSGGISNTYVGERVYVIDPVIGGSGTFPGGMTIPPQIDFDNNKIELLVGGTTIEKVDGVNSSSIVTTSNSITSTVTDGSEQHSITIDSATNRITLFTNDGSSPNYQSELRVSTEGGGAAINIGSQNLTSGQVATHNLTETSIVSTVSDGIGTQSSIDIQPASVITTATDGTNTGQFNLQPVSAQISLDQNGLTDVTLDPQQIGIGTTDGSYTSRLDIQPSTIISTVTSASGETIMELTDTYISLTRQDGIGTQSTITSYTSQLSISSTDGTGTGTINVSATSNDISLGDGTNSTNLTQDPSYTSISTTDGVNSTSLSIEADKFDVVLGGRFNVNGIPAYDDDAAAGGAGLTTGDLYQTTGSASNPLDVAGILMIKQ